MKLGAKKCTFAANEVSYLGHRVTSEGLLPDPALLKAIRDIEPPRNASEARSFLGLAGYYRRYTKNFAAIAGTLRTLTKKDAVFHWNDECQQAFDRLKTLLTTSPITAFPDFNLHFRLYTDASTAGLGAILVQIQDRKERIICCASRSLNQAEKAYPATKLECLTIVWTVTKFRPYLMSMSFEVYTDHYALQWLKTMRMGSALLHRWSAALEEYDFTVKHRPGKIQTHVGGLSRLPIDPPPPEDTDLQIHVLEEEEEPRTIACEMHTATHLGGHALWKLFRDRHSHKAGWRICLEVAQSCPRCQLGTDYGHRQRTTCTIQSQGPWDTLSINIVGPLPTGRRKEFLIVFVDCFSKYTILMPSSKALMRHVIPNFGTPRRLLSDRGRAFISFIWTQLLRTLGIQQVLISPYHPERNAITKRSHRTLNNMLHARLLEGSSTKAWVDKILGIMLTLNAMPHEPHGFSASMIATGREPTLPPDLATDANPSPSSEDAPYYVEKIRQGLQLTHQQMTLPPTDAPPNPHQEGNLVYVLTPHPEKTSKLTPCWRGPYRVCRIPNDYQVVYEDNGVERTVHINHVKPAKFTAPDLPEVVPPAEPPSPLLGYLPTGLTHAPARPPRARNQPPAAPAAPAKLPVSPPNPPAAPEAPIDVPMAPIDHPAAPAAPPPAPNPPRRGSPRLNPAQGQANAIRSPCATRKSPRQHQSASEPLTVHTSSLSRSEMARLRPLNILYHLALGPKQNVLSFASLHLVDLHNRTRRYLTTLKDLRRALPKTTVGGACLTLQGSVTRPGKRCLRKSMRAAIWFLLPSDGEFTLNPVSLQYYLARRGRLVILRGGDITGRPLEDKLNWEQGLHEEKEKENSPLSTPENRNKEKLPLGKREERRKSSSLQNKVKLPIQSANQFFQSNGKWMQDPRSVHSKGKSPFWETRKGNPPLRHDTEGRRESGAHKKENSPLPTANWESSLHRKSHQGVNWKKQDNPTAVPGPLLPSRQHPTRMAPCNSHTPHPPYKQARRSKGKQVRARTQLEHISGGASFPHPALLEFDLKGGASSLQPTAHEGASSLHRAPHQYPGGASSLHPALLEFDLQGGASSLQATAHKGASSLHRPPHQYPGGTSSLPPITREGISSLHRLTQQYQGGALSLPLQRSDCPDVTLQIWPEPPFDGPASRTPRESQQPTDPVSRVPREDQPITLIEIPCGSPTPAEGRPHTPDSPQCPETQGKWFRPDLQTRSPVRARLPSPPSPPPPRHPRKHSPPSPGWWLGHRMKK